MKEYLYLEHDGKLLLVNNDGKGPEKPVMGRTHSGDSLIRLPTIDEVKDMGIKWEKKRENSIHFKDDGAKVIIASPRIEWPENWAWKDFVISDNAVDPIARESVYRTIHRVVSKVIIENDQGMILMAKSSRGFFNGCWTLPGGFVDYGEHPRQAAIREAKEELGIEIEIADHLGESGNRKKGNDGVFIQENIFTSEGINWLSFTYRAISNTNIENIIPKKDEIEEAKWFTKENALRNSVSLFDKEALLALNK
jgi:ADP-ribose pyrophosphatase YjhB (NUDIX family)